MLSFDSVFIDQNQIFLNFIRIDKDINLFKSNNLQKIVKITINSDDFINLQTNTLILFPIHNHISLNK